MESRGDDVICLGFSSAIDEEILRGGTDEDGGVTGKIECDELRRR